MPSVLELNPEQRKAVEHGEGPLLVIAGPGSGKTRVITERIVYLLQCGVYGARRSESSATPGAERRSREGGTGATVSAGLKPAATVTAVQPESILALTFTDKAAEEMKRRVRDALPELAKLPHISTFHAFCYHVLRERHFERQLLDRVDVWIFLRRRIEQLGLDFYQKLAEPGAFLHDLNEFFSRCQDELIEPDDFDAFVRKLEQDLLERGATLPSDAAQVPGAATLDPAERKLIEEELEKKRELARVFRNSRRLIEEAGCSSLGSLISETVRLWNREPEVLERYQERFQYILVDEFQDTNYGQAELLRRLAAPPYNLTAVGDDDQAIYRFRGASHGAFQMFDEAFPGHETVYLDRNYRSTKRVLRAAEALISQNDRYEKKQPLRTDKGEGCTVFLPESTDDRSEAAWVADEVERLVVRGRSFADVAVLYRSHHYRDLLVNEFRRRQIPFAIRGLSILSTVILRDLVAYLTLVYSPHHDVSLTRVLLAPHWRFPEDLALEIRKQASKDRCSLFDALGAGEQTLLGDELKNTGWPELKTLLRDLRKRAEQVSVEAFFEELTEKLGLRLLPHGQDKASMDAFKKFLGDWERKSATRKLREFMEYFQYFREAGGQIEAPEPEDPSNAVQMMTVHAAKGLEFPIVFVLSVSRRRFPHSEQRPVIEFPDELRRAPAPPHNIHLQEERRLFYVAVTRAQERLYISSLAKPGQKPSQFVEDLLSDAVVRGRDIERIQVSAAPSEAATSERVLLSEVADPAVGQRSLFREGSASRGSTHPNLREWATRAPAISPNQKIQLSATAIEDYQGCPLKFKFSHYFKIPTGPQPALTFGNIMHQCVRRYFELRKKGMPRFEEIEKFYLEAWKGAGFEDAYQEETYKNAGLAQLREFVARQNGSVTRADQIRMEERFLLDLGDIVLEGRIDQINPLGAAKRGGKTAVELVDYKTGRPRSQKDADKSLQLSVYALAARDQLKLKPARLTFYNLTNNQPVSTVRTDKDLEGSLRVIREVADQIRQRLFPPTPGFVCKRCDFVPICPAHEEVL